MEQMNQIKFIKYVPESIKKWWLSLFKTLFKTTVNGVVVHGIKINNMIWAAFTRSFGWPDGSAYLGSQGNQVLRGFPFHMELDTPAASYAVTTGEGKIYDWLEGGAVEPFTEILDANDIRLMQEPAIEDPDLHILWPSPDPLDMNNSQMIKPDLLVPWPPLF